MIQYQDEVEVTLGAMPEYSHLTHKERHKVATLKRRANFLRGRHQSMAEKSPNIPTWDLQEIAALEFAIRYIALHDPIDESSTAKTET